MASGFKKDDPPFCYETRLFFPALVYIAKWKIKNPQIVVQLLMGRFRVSSYLTCSPIYLESRSTNQTRPILSATQ